MLLQRPNTRYDNTFCLFIISIQSVVPLDLTIILKNCHRDARLVLTIPWIVEYLSMMDHVAPQLQHYQTVLKLLVQIYR